MSNVRKLSAFRQLSLNCSPTPEQRRKTLKKQFSEDIPDYKEKWIDPGVGIKISLNTKSNRNIDRPLPIRIAWEENTLKTEDAVIIKKCKEVRRGSTGKLSKRNSLEKNSILHSKQELTERFKPIVKEKGQEKTNLKIFLAHSPTEDIFTSQPECNYYLEKSEPPKLIQPLMTNNVSNSNSSKNLFQFRRNFKPKINLTEIAYSPTRTIGRESSHSRNDTIVVVPMVEKDQNELKLDNIETPTASKIRESKEDIKPIDSVVLRPATAASKREKFQKRTNSAFNATIKESPNTRPPLVRSSSAPSKSDRSRPKFSATKRKIKANKRVQLNNHLGEDDLDYNISCNKENPKSQKELNRTAAVSGSDIITMVSLVSPAGSDGEEESVGEVKEKSKTKTNSINAKSNITKEDKATPKNMTLRKIVKTVSFQQSSIHAIRSFSASFPARRGSMATALMSSNNTKTTSHSTKVQEKRSTNSNTPDDDERVPKRRLLKNDSEDEQNTISCEEPETTEPNDNGILENPSNFTIDIKSKIITKTEESTSREIVNEVQPELVSDTIPKEVEKIKEDTKYESQKEKQCWEVYCKMTQKGISVSFDTILRGMLTPTEYRKSRQNAFVASLEKSEEEPS